MPRRPELATETVQELGFTTGEVSPCLWHHAKGDLFGLAHRDDFVLVGRGRQLTIFRSRWAVRTRSRSQPQVKTTGTCTTHGIDSQGDRRHAADRPFGEEGVTTRQTVVTPAVPDSRRAKRSESDATDADGDPSVRAIGHCSSRCLATQPTGLQKQYPGT